MSGHFGFVGVCKKHGVTSCLLLFNQKYQNRAIGIKQITRCDPMHATNSWDVSPEEFIDVVNNMSTIDKKQFKDVQGMNATEMVGTAKNKFNSSIENGRNTWDVLDKKK